MKKILLIATGGTIASKYTDKGLSPQISAEELLSYVPEAREFCEIDHIQPFNLDSTNVCARQWTQLAALIEKKYEYYDGFVICHGTDTMAYTAAALSYLIQNNLKPIVVTGAQKPIDLAITDARANLLDSLRFASHPKAHGTNIVFGGSVIAGTRDDEFYQAIKRFVEKGKIVIMATQVTHEGSDMSVYQVGKMIKREFSLLESYDMTLEATVAKTMWALQESIDPDGFREKFYKKINHDIMFSPEQNH